MQKRGVFVDHVTLHHLALKVLPVLGLVLRQRKRAFGRSLRVDEKF